jgi:DNA (cytosine-5)-methyltransferase 1
MYHPTASGFFSGIGGMELGLQNAGIRFVQSMDICKNATAWMRRNSNYFTHEIIQNDITQTTVSNQPDADIIVGTYPCNKYSSIADIHGTRTGDDLYLHFFRHLAIKRPEVYILENVPGMRKFPVVMEAMSKLPGYYVNIFCPVNAECWLPQRRERLILIGSKKRMVVNAPAARRKITLRNIIENDAEIKVNKTVISRLKGHYRDMPIIVDASDNNAVAPTCVAHYHKDMGTRLVKDARYKHGVRPFTVREYARLQGFPDDFIFPDKRYAYQLIGNAVPVPMAEYFGRSIVKYFN